MSMPLERLNAQEQQNTGTAWTRNETFDKYGFLVIRNSGIQKNFLDLFQKLGVK